MNGTNQRGGINPLSPTQNHTVSVGAAQANVNLTPAQRQTILERAADRYCPECGTHYRAKDVKWIRGAPACRVCGFKPLRKMSR